MIAVGGQGRGVLNRLIAMFRLVTIGELIRGGGELEHELDDELSFLSCAVS